MHNCSFFTFFGRHRTLAFFKKVKNAPCYFSEMKNKPCPFSTISKARKLDCCQISRNATWKVCVQKNSCTQKQQILRQNAILFLHGETFNKEVNNFWYCDCDCALTAAHSSEKLNLRMIFNNYFKTVPSFPQKRLIWPPTTILLLHGEVLTERLNGVLLMVQSELCIDSYRIIWGIQQKDSLNYLFQNFSRLLPMKMPDFMTHRYFVS